MSAAAAPQTANDRFKNGFGNWFWGSVVTAVIVHFLIFAFWPTMTAADSSFATEELRTLDIPPEVPVPPEPNEILRPANPVVSAEIDDNITIAPTTFDDNPITSIRMPPTGAEQSADISDAPQFTPFTVKPELRNRAAIATALIRNYPPLLRDAGIGGRATVWFLIDEEGRVQKTQLNESSGYDALDQAALQVAGMMQFSPALNRDKKVPVWVSIPIAFSSR